MIEHKIIQSRVVERADDGSYFCSNAVTLFYKDMDGHDITFYCQPEGLYQTVLTGMRQMAQIDNESESDAALSSEMRALKKQLARVIKASVKGLLMMWGEKLLTLFYGTTQHPHPPKEKKLDLVDWYMQEFTKLFIANMMKKDLFLTGQFVHPTENGYSSVVSVNEIYTRPVSGDSQESGDTGVSNT